MLKMLSSLMRPRKMAQVCIQKSGRKKTSDRNTQNEIDSRFDTSQERISKHKATTMEPMVKTQQGSTVSQHQASNDCKI